MFACPFRVLLCIWTRGGEHRQLRTHRRGRSHVRTHARTRTSAMRSIPTAFFSCKSKQTNKRTNERTNELTRKGHAGPRRATPGRAHAALGVQVQRPRGLKVRRFDGWTNARGRAALGRNAFDPAARLAGSAASTCNGTNKTRIAMDPDDDDGRARSEGD